MLRRMFEPVEVHDCLRCGYRGPFPHPSRRCRSCGFCPDTPHAYPASAVYYTHRQLWTAWQMSLMLGAFLHGVLMVGFPLGHDWAATLKAGMLALLIGEALTLPVTLLALQPPERSGASDPLRWCALMGLTPALLLAPVGLLLFLVPEHANPYAGRGGNIVSCTIGAVGFFVTLAVTAFTMTWHAGLVIGASIALGSALVVAAWTVRTLVRLVRGG